MATNCPALEDAEEVAELHGPREERSRLRQLDQRLHGRDIVRP
jgi:hypothetical protein